LIADEIKALCRVIKAPRDRAIVMLLYFCPWDLREITGLRLRDWNDVPDVLFPRITVPWTRPSWRVLGPRTDRTAFDLRSRRTNPDLARKVANAVRAWLRIRGRSPGPLFTSRFGAGGRIGRKQIMDLLRSYAEEAGLPSPEAILQNIQRLGHLERMEEVYWRMENC
jgi:integrase